MKPRRVRFGRGSATAISVGAHGFAAAALLMLTERVPPVPSAEVAVEIAALSPPQAAPPPAAPAASAAEAPSPEPQLAGQPEEPALAPEPADLHRFAEESALEPEAIPPPPPPKPAPLRPIGQAKKRPQSPARLAVAQTMPEPDALTQAVAPNYPAALPRAEAASPAPSESGGPPPNWLAAVRSQLERNKAYPDSARFRRQEGTAVLRFVIDRRGQVLSHAIVKSSGVSSLDKAAEEMLRRASPVPPMPSEIASDRFELTIPVSFTLSRR